MLAWTEPAEKSLVDPPLFAPKDDDVLIQLSIDRYITERRLSAFFAPISSRCSGGHRQDNFSIRVHLKLLVQRILSIRRTGQQKESEDRAPHYSALPKLM